MGVVRSRMFPVPDFGCFHSAGKPKEEERGRDGHAMKATKTKKDGKRKRRASVEALLRRHGQLVQMGADLDVAARNGEGLSRKKGTTTPSSLSERGGTADPSVFSSPSFAELRRIWRRRSAGTMAGAGGDGDDDPDFSWLVGRDSSADAVAGGVSRGKGKGEEMEKDDFDWRKAEEEEWEETKMAEVEEEEREMAVTVAARKVNAAVGISVGNCPLRRSGRRIMPKRRYP